LYRNYAQAYKEPTGKFAKGTAGETQKLIAQVLNEGRTPTEAMNLLFGYSKLGEKQATARVARRLKEFLVRVLWSLRHFDLLRLPDCLRTL
jgi:hypothetical protein